MVNREGAKDAKENDFFRIGTNDSEKIPALRATRPQVSVVPPSAKLIDSFLLPICASARENLAFLAP
jgi:hypothetical protein